MKYSYARQLYERRKKGTADKILYHGQAVMVKEGDDFVFYLRHRRWTSTTGTRYETSRERFAVLKPNNSLCLLLDINSSSLSAKSFFCWIAGFGRIYSLKSHYHQHTYSLRFLDKWDGVRSMNSWVRGWEVNVPAAAGLTVDTNKLVVLRHVPDEIRKTIREKAKPIYAYAKRVTQVMEVMMRVGALDDAAHAAKLGEMRKAYGSYYGPQFRNILYNSPTVMNEDNLAIHAENAFYHVNYRSLGPSSWYLDPVTRTYKQRADSEYEVAKRKAVLRFARRSLIKFLKDAHDTYERQVLPSEFKKAT